MLYHYMFSNAIIKRNQLTILARCLILLIIAGCQTPQSLEKNHQIPQSQGKRLEIVKQRGKLICGINEQLIGFSYKEADGSYSGISVDLCKAIAAALFDDPTKVEYRHLKSAERFQAVVSGKVDILSRNTTWTFSRDTAGGLEFPPTNFYDGQGLLVDQGSGINQLADLNNKSICIPVRTTSETNLAEHMRKQNLSYTPVLFEDINQLYNAYENQECDAVTGDRSELVARRSQFQDPAAHQVLESVLSKEPLGPVIANGEPAWFDVVKWVSYALIKAEELHINSQNIDYLNHAKNPEIRRFIGIEGDMGARLALPDDFARRTIKHVGNYREVYERNMGKPFNLERGINALWKDGGLMYSPPFR